MQKKNIIKEGLPAFRCYSYFVLLVTEKVAFDQPTGVQSTRLLVKIHNN